MLYFAGQYTERIDEKTLNKKLKSTPSRRYGSTHLFRDMEDSGIAVLSSLTTLTQRPIVTDL